MKNKSRSSRTKRTTTRSVLRLPDLEHAKAAVLNSLTSPDAKRGYGHAIDEFVDWYCSLFRTAISVEPNCSPTLSLSSGIPTTCPWDHQASARCCAPSRLRSS